MYKFDATLLGDPVGEISVESIVDKKYFINHAELINSEGEVVSKDKVTRLSIDGRRLRVLVHGRSYSIALADIESVTEYKDHFMVKYGHGQYQNLRLVLQKFAFEA